MKTRHVLLCTLLLSFAASAEELRLVRDRIFVPVEVDGVATQALLDSGAEMTLLDAAFAARLDLALEGNEMAKGTGGEQAVRFATGIDIDSAGVRLTDLTAAVLDLSDVSRRLVGEPLTVVLGRELFDSARWRLDPVLGRLERVPVDRDPPGVELPLRDHAGIKQIPVRVDGVDTWADLDLGNGNEMLLGHDFAERQSWLTPERDAGARPGGGLGGSLLRQRIRLGAVEIAGMTFTDVVAAVDTTTQAADANVGVSLLRHFVLTIDFPADKVWLAPVATSTKSN